MDRPSPRSRFVPAALAVLLTAAGVVSAAAQSGRAVPKQPLQTKSRPASAPATRAASMPASDPASGATSRPATPADPMRDAAADRITREMVKAIGGEGALDRTRTIRFLFGSSVRDTARGGRRHWWDRTTGDYRIEGTTRAGQVYVLIFNTETREGKAWLDGEPMEGEELDRYLERAYAIYINDTYWFLMPHKMLDPGVRLAYDGEAIVDGSTCDRIRVTFDSVGLTPGDTYWAYIDPKTHLMKRWGFILGHQRQDPDATERLYDWTGWTYYGGLRLATQRPAVDSPDRRIVLCTGIQVDQAFPGDVFTNPRPIGF